MTTKIFDHLKNLNVLIIGETITDSFYEVEYQGNSMKSFCSVVRILNSKEPQIQRGGAMAIYRHLEDFVKNIDIITNSPEEIEKIRYVDAKSGISHIELNKFNLTTTLNDYNMKFSDYDFILVADFGHGFIDLIEQTENMCFMVQTNSNNYGFNRVSKWKHLTKRYACIDEREARLQLNLKELNNNSVEDLYNYELDSKYAVITQGKNGGVYYNGNQKVFYKSYVQDNFIDSIGAGDTFFAFSSLLLGENEKDNSILNFCSLLASFTTQWRGNEKHINKNLLKQKHVI